MNKDEHHPAAHETINWNAGYGGNADDYKAPDAQLVDLIKGLSPGRALDVGRGAGGLVVELTHLGWQVTGVDVAEQAIRAAREVTSQKAFRRS